MLDRLILVVAIAALFYIVIPGIGAVTTRTRWRRFRAQITGASWLPTVSYRQLNASSTISERTRIGEFRCFGALEAIEGDNVVWVRDRNFSIACDMRNVRVFLLAAESGWSGYQEAPLSDRLGTPIEPPTVVRWEGLSSLPEGTGMFVAGPLYAEGGRPKFQSSSEEKLLVVLYDGAPETVLRRCIVSGRQRNEFWNQVTPIALTAGALALLLAAYILVQQPLMRLPAIIAAGLGLVPILPMLPPAVPLFFLYRSLWRRGRALRAERDVLRLPLRYFRGDEDTAVLPDGEPYLEMVVSRKQADLLQQRGAALERLPFGSDGDWEPIEFYAFGKAADASGEASNGATAGPFAGPPDVPADEPAASEREQTDPPVPLERPRDPMAELVVVAGGHPSWLAKQCQRRAKRLELSALVTFAATIVINLYLVLLVVSRLIR